MINGVVTGEHDLRDPAIVGFKFSRQAQLRGAGFPVPPFYCLPAAAFDAAAAAAAAELAVATIGAAGAADGVRQSAGPDDLVLAHARRLRAAIIERGVPDPLAAELLRHFDDLIGTTGLAAVRACAVANGDGQGEDGAADSFAGLSDSFLYVRRAELRERVAACWASAYNERAVRYRQRRGHSPLSARICVGVQRMVPAARSFVAFTRDPVDGGDRCVIAAAYGVGEGIVQERADLDHFYVDLASGTVDRRLVRKTRMVGRGGAGTGAGVAVLAVPDALAAAAVLTDAQAVQIATLATAIETHFGTAQDIEGAITAGEQLMVVQARPIAQVAQAPPGRPGGDQATGAPGSARAGGPAGSPAGAGSQPHGASERAARDDDAQITWANSNVTESFPGVCGALTYSVAAQFGEKIFTDFYRRMGVPEQVLRAHEHDLRRMIGYLNGRIYNRLDTWYALHSQIPSFAALRSTWEPGIGLPPAALRAASAMRPAAGRARRVAHYLSLAAGLGRHRAQIRQFLRWWDARHAEQAEVDLTQVPAGVLAEEYHRLCAQVDARWGVASVNNYYLIVASRLTAALVRRWAVAAEPGVLVGMLCGGAENRSTAAARSALDLAERVAGSAELRTAVLQRDERQVWAELIAGTYGSEFAAAVAAHVRRYGDRGVRDHKLETVTIRQEPWTLLRMLRAYVHESLTADGNRRSEQETRARAERELRAGCRGVLRRAVLRRCYGLLRELFRLREDTRFCRSQLFGTSRAIFLALGERLAGTGLLDDSRDVLDLTAQEVVGAFQGTLPGADLAGIARVRRAQREAWQRGPEPPPVLRADPSVPLTAELARQAMPETAGPATGQLLTGIGSSPGRVRAKARVILDPTTDVGECRGHILVAGETDPGWLFLMMAAKGIVVERGSPVSHAAITGRMLSIPTVVAVAGATKRIRDGDWVELDGVAGTVTLLAQPGVPPGAGDHEGVFA
jgi:pyruvate,water dikinase